MKSRLNYLLITTSKYILLLLFGRGFIYLVKKDEVTVEKIEVKNIQITKVDHMIVFYNAMWSIIAQLPILVFDRFLSVENLSIKVREPAPK